MPDIITFGEMLIDFVPTISGVSLMDAPAFIKAPGGATANVAVGAARLGVSAGFMGKVGDDAFGRFLERTLHEANVDTHALRFAANARTSLAFVSLRADGEREFVFYRHMDKDLLLMYAPTEVDTDYIRGGKIFHYGSIGLIDETSRNATRLAVSTARSAGLTISYDPNLRLNLWPDEATARDGLLTGWRQAHIIKASEDEMTFLTGKTDLTAAVDQLWHSDLKLLVVTLGKHGCRYFTPKFNGEVGSFEVTSVDTTGAGDGFVAGLLTGLQQHTNALTDEGTLRKICRRANAVGALTTTQRGAIPALPTVEQLNSFLDQSAHA